MNTAQTTENTAVFVPDIDPFYVETKYYKQVKNIVEKAGSMFYTAYVKGHKGCGKTLTIRQVCAQLKRPYCEFQITPNMLAEDYIGSKMIVNHETIFQESSLVTAMRLGAVLNLDEFDKADGSVLELQNILEGRGVLIKKTGEYVKPKAGFCIFATANTLGRGLENDLYTTSQILDASTLDRFKEFIDAEYISPEKEAEALTRYCANHSVNFSSDDIISLAKWAKDLRASFENQTNDDLVSTRGLFNIVQIAFMHNYNVKTSVAAYLTRFRPDVRIAFTNVFNSIHTVNSAMSDSGRANPSSTLPNNVNPANPFNLS